MKHSAMVGLAAALVAFAVAGPALADNEAGMYGNTVVCTYPNGGTTKVYLKQGGDYTVIRGGQTIQGKWTDDGTSICYHETDPAQPSDAKDVCTPSKAYKVGDSWTVTDPVGKTCKAELKAGHV